MVPALDFLGAGGEVLRSLGDAADKPIFQMTYHFPKTIGKKGRPNPDAERFPEGIKICLPQGLVIFILSVGGAVALFAFWDAIVMYLDKQGYRDKNNTMWSNLMGLGVLGGAQDALAKGGGAINKASGDFQDALRKKAKEAQDALGKLGAQMQGK
jgi:hypothetical protein